jgi:hypothetical protein
MIKGVLFSASLLSPLVAHAQTNFTTSGAVQISVGQGNVPPDSFSSEPASPPNKDLVVFTSGASNLVAGDTNESPDVFQYTPDKGIELISVIASTGQAPQTGSSSHASISAIQPDGSYAVAFMSNATDLVPGYSSPISSTYNPLQVYVRLPLSNETLLVSKGIPTTSIPGQVGADAECDDIAIVALQNPARYLIAFRSFAHNLRPPSQTAGLQYRTIFTVPITFSNGQAVVGAPQEALDPTTGTRYTGDLNNPQFSGNGRFIAFTTTAPITGLSSEYQQVYLHDRSTQQNKLISRTPAGLPGNAESTTPAVSHRAENIVFMSKASDIAGSGTATKIIRFDNDAETFSQVNLSASGEASNGEAFQAKVSPSGLLVAFSDAGTNLVSDTNTNGMIQTYLKDVRSGAIIRTSVTSSLAAGDGDSGGMNFQVTSLQNPPSTSPTFYDPGQLLSFGALGYNGSTIFTSFRSAAPNLTTYFINGGQFSNVFRTPVTPPKPRLVQNGQIEAPPDVFILKQLGGNRGARVQIVMQEFSDIFPAAGVSAASVEALASASARLKYHLEIRKAGSKQQIFRTLSKNKTVINRLSPGRYSIRYRVSKTTGKKTLRSAYSTKQQLQVS